MAYNRFVDKPSAAFTDLVAAMERLEASEATLARAYATATSPHLLASWRESQRVKESSGHACIQRVLGRRTCSNTRFETLGEMPCRPPGTDHPSLWLRDGKPAVYVSQPYGLSGAELAEMVAFAGEHGLHLNIDTWPAWHFPTAVLHVEWWAEWAWREFVGYGKRL